MSPLPAGPAESGAAAHVVVSDLDNDTPEVCADDVHHLHRVLRLRPNEIVTVTDGAGRWRPCTPPDRWPREGPAQLVATGPISFVARVDPLLFVGFGLAKGDRPEWVVQKITELGVDHIIPVVCARSVVRWEGERATRHIQRLRAVAREAVMQSRQCWVPVVHDVEDFADLVRRTSADARDAARSAPGGVKGWPTAEPVLADREGSPPSLAAPFVLVGPEGGWSDAERDSVSGRMSVGSSVLRAETAAVVVASALALLRSRLVGPRA